MLARAPRAGPVLIIITQVGGGDGGRASLLDRLLKDLPGREPLEAGRRRFAAAQAPAFAQAPASAARGRAAKRCPHCRTGRPATLCAGFHAICACARHQCVDMWQPPHSCRELQEFSTASPPAAKKAAASCAGRSWRRRRRSRRTMMHGLLHHHAAAAAAKTTPRRKACRDAASSFALRFSAIEGMRPTESSEDKLKPTPPHWIPLLPPDKEPAARRTKTLESQALQQGENRDGEQRQR